MFISRFISTWRGVERWEWWIDSCYNQRQHFHEEWKPCGFCWISCDIPIFNKPCKIQQYSAFDMFELSPIIYTCIDLHPICHSLLFRTFGPMLFQHDWDEVMLNSRRGKVESLLLLGFKPIFSSPWPGEGSVGGSVVHRFNKLTISGNGLMGEGPVSGILRNAEWKDVKCKHHAITNP